MTDAYPLTVEGLGSGEPPPEMAEAFGMEAVPDAGEGDEADGEVVDVAAAEAESEKAANS